MALVCVRMRLVLFRLSYGGFFMRKIFQLLINGLALTCWSAAAAAIMLPYQVFRVFLPARRPGRPGSHPISKVFTRVFENKKTKRFVGVGLTIFIMLFGVIGNILAANEIGAADQTLIMVPDSQVVTEVGLNKPLEGVRAQGFHNFHRGVDILALVETEIKPIAKGRVIETRYGRIGWGNTVVVEHEKGLSSRYAHMKEIKVIEGEIIEKDYVLGTVGMTGWTTGPHLHLEIYQNGKAVDPQSVLPEFSL